MGLKTTVTVTSQASAGMPMVRIQPGEHSTRLRAAVVDGSLGYELRVAADPTREQLRGLGAAVVDEASKAHLSKVAVSVPSLESEQLEEFAIGMLLAGYRFDTYRTKEDPDAFLCSQIELVTQPNLEAALERALVLAEAVALAQEI